MHVRTLILGAGAAGLFCAAHAGPDTLVVDHAKAAGEKIRISGGGRCNFTNIYTGPGNFLSQNPHFAISALRRYGPHDFVARVDAAGIPWHEKTLGQLFCDKSAKDLIAMLLADVSAAGGKVWTKTKICSVGKSKTFDVKLERDGTSLTVSADHLVVATGGKSIPKMGASGIGYDIARQFGLNVVPTRAALVPFTFGHDSFKPLAGIATSVRARAGEGCFDEAMLFTHRGLSGPAMLQISSYWSEGEIVEIDLFPNRNMFEHLTNRRKENGRKSLRTILSEDLPTRLVDGLELGVDTTRNLADFGNEALSSVASSLHNWTVRPGGTEGYRTAEVTLGGVDTDDLSSKSMAAKSDPSLYFIGEVVDVTGWLGGYNFQWAWASAHAAATDIVGG